MGLDHSGLTNAIHYCHTGTPAGLGTPTRHFYCVQYVGR